jgi:predicted RNA-binding protein YlqC (UPF0109 family)
VSEASVDTSQNGDHAVAALTELVRYLTGELVDEASEAVVTADRRGNHIAVRLELPEQYLGQVIGRGGRIARSLRTALMIAGSRHDVRVSLDIEGTPPLQHVDA